MSDTPLSRTSRIVAQARKELTQLSRDRLTLALALVLPLVQMWLIGESVSLSVTDLPVVIQDHDRTPTSRRYEEAIRASLTFRVVPDTAVASAESALDRGDARAVVVIPPGFERDLLRGRDVELQWLLDGTDANTANLMRGDAAAITSAFAAGPGGRRPSAIRTMTRIWFNPGRDSDQYIGPAVFALCLALFPPLLVVLAMSRETEQRTILQVYVSSISAFEYLAGKVLAYILVAAAEWGLTLALAVWLYGLTLVHGVGGAAPFLLSSALFLFCTVSFGLLLGVRVPDQASAIQAVQNFGFLLSYLMSGFVYPLSNIPAGLRWVSNVVPARFFIEASRDAFVRGGGWAAIWHAPAMLALLGGFFFFSAWMRMRRMQEDL